MKFSEVNFGKIPNEASKHHRRFFERRVRKMFIKYLAYTNQFDGILAEKEIEEAKCGYLPKDLDVHHIFPLSGSLSEDVNSFTNLSVIHKQTHRQINREIFDPQFRALDKLPVGGSITLRLPLFPPVDGDGILEERAIVARKLKRREAVQKMLPALPLPSFPFFQRCP